MLTRSFLVATCFFTVSGGRLLADDVRYFDRDGMTYRETRQITSRPMIETRLEQKERVVYRDQYTTEMHDQERTYQTPVTEYQWVPTWQRSWNIFLPPSLVYQYAPVTRWETRKEVVRIPVTRRESVPEKRQEQVPVTTQRCVQDVRITQMAIGPAGTVRTDSGGASSTAGGSTPAASSDPFASAGEPTVARRETVGGVDKLDKDPPREGLSWRSAGPTVRR